MASSRTEALVDPDLEIERADVLRHFAHDLKNPLTAVRVLIEMMVEEVDGQAREDLEDVIEAVDLCAAMAEGLSDLARVEAGAEPTYEIEIQDLTAVVNAVAERAGMRKYVRMTALPSVGARVDPAAAKRALTAVLLNARRMLPAASVELALFEDARIEVLHPGLELRPADCADLLHPYGASRLRDRRLGASALGLFYARMTLEWLGGSLDVVPAPEGLRVVMRFMPAPRRSSGR